MWGGAFGLEWCVATKDIDEALHRMRLMHKKALADVVKDQNMLGYTVDSRQCFPNYANGKWTVPLDVQKKKPNTMFSEAANKARIYR